MFYARPDLAHWISVLSGYLRRSSDLRLKFRRCRDGLILKGYTDSRLHVVQ